MEYSNNTNIHIIIINFCFNYLFSMEPVSIPNHSKTTLITIW